MRKYTNRCAQETIAVFPLGAIGISPSLSWVFRYVYIVWNVAKSRTLKAWRRLNQENLTKFTDFKELKYLRYCTTSGLMLGMQRRTTAKQFTLPQCKGSDRIRLVFAHPFPLNSGAPIASAKFILIMKPAQLMGAPLFNTNGRAQSSPYPVRPFGRISQTLNHRPLLTYPSWNYDFCFLGRARMSQTFWTRGLTSLGFTGTPGLMSPAGHLMILWSGLQSFRVCEFTSPNSALFWM